MNARKLIKIIVDVFMYLLFVYLMCLSTTRFNSKCFGLTPQTWHGIAGIFLFAIFVVHHVLNKSFYKSTFKGRYNAERIILSATDWIFFILMILMAISSILLAGQAFPFIHSPYLSGAKPFHILICTWAFFVMSVHMSLHFDRFLFKLEHKINSRAVRWILFTVLYALVLACGIYSYIGQSLYVFMFTKNSFKLSPENIWLSMLEFIFISFAVCVLVHGIKSFVRAVRRGQNEKLNAEKE